MGALDGAYQLVQFEVDGGTVAILGTTGAEGAVREIAARYAAEAGRAVEVFSRSGPGAAQMGVQVLETTS